MAALMDWKPVYIFLSSTFQDMHAERDYLTKCVFPQLRDWCEERRLRLREIDLRWGVTEVEATQNRAAVKICLEGIAACRPFFLCFIGQRSGWKPSKDEISATTYAEFPGLHDVVDGSTSITEIEIMHALTRPFRDEHAHGPAGLSRRTFFYLREDRYVVDLPENVPLLHDIYVEGDTSLRGLAKQTAQDFHRPLRAYDAEWLPDARSPELAMPLECPFEIPTRVAEWRETWQRAGVAGVSGTTLLDNPSLTAQARQVNERITRGRLGHFTVEGQPLSDVILRDLQQAIADEFPEHLPSTGDSDLQKEVDQQEQFLFASTEGFFPREGDFTALDAYVDRPAPGVFALTGAGGMGKSTLLANWIDGRRKRGADGRPVFFRFIGAGDASTTMLGLQRSLLAEMIDRVHLDLAQPDEPALLPEAWRTALQMLDRAGGAIIVIDALNQLGSGFTGLEWLLRPPPPGVKLILSFRFDETETDGGAREFHAALQVAGGELSAIKPFTSIADRRKLVDAYLSQYLKRLDDSHIDIVIGAKGDDNPGAANPLYLRVVLSELRIFGAYAQLPEKLKNTFGTTPESAFAGLLSRLESDPVYTPVPTGEAVPLLFGLLAHARRGLSVEELAAEFTRVLQGVTEQEAADTVNVLVRQVRPYLARRDQRYDFFYESFRLAALARSTDGPRLLLARDWHRRLAQLFREMPASPASSAVAALPARRVSELPYHQTMAGDWLGLRSTLTDLAFLQAKVTQRMADDLLDDFERALAFLPERKAGRRGQSQRLHRVFRELMLALRQEMFAVRDRPRLTAQQLYNNLYARVGFFGPVGAILRAVARRGAYPDGGAWLRQSRQGQRMSVSPSLLRTLAGHRAPVTTVASSPGGRWLASGGLDGVVHVWDTTSGIATARFPAHKGGVFALAWRHGDEGEARLFTAGRDQTIAAWDWRTEQELVRWNAHEGLGLSHVRGLVCLGGGLLASCGDDQSVRLWQLDDGAPVRAFREPRDRVLGLAADDDGAVIVAGSDEGAVWVFPAGGGEARALRGHLDRVRSVSVDGPGRLAVSAGDDQTVRVWDLRDARQVHTWPVQAPGLPRSVLILPHAPVETPSPQGAAEDRHQQFAVGRDDGVIEIRDVKSGTVVSTLRGHRGAVNALAAGPDGRWFVSAGNDGTVRMWETAFLTVKQDAVAEHTQAVTRVECDGTGGAIVTASRDGSLRVWSADGRSLHVLRGHAGAVRCTVFLDDHRLVSGSDDHTLYIWDVTRGDSIAQLALDPTMALLLARVRISVTNGLGPTNGGHVGPVTCVARAGAGRLVSGGADRTVRLWDIGTYQEVRRIGEHLGPVEALVADTESGIVAAAGVARAISLWPLAEAVDPVLLTGHEGAVSHLALIPGHALVSAGRDGAIYRWGLPSGRLEATWVAHDGPVTALIPAQGGDHIVSGGVDGLVRVWAPDVPEPRTLAGLDAPVAAIAAHIGLGLAVAVAEDGWVIAWDVTLGQELARAHPGVPLSTLLARWPNEFWLGTAWGGVTVLHVERGTSRAPKGGMGWGS